MHVTAEEMERNSKLITMNVADDCQNLASANSKISNHHMRFHFTDREQEYQSTGGIFVHIS